MVPLTWRAKYLSVANAVISKEPDEARLDHTYAQVAEANRDLDTCDEDIVEDLDCQCCLNRSDHLE